MPIRITFTDGRKIEFIYDATGKKWRKTAINANNTTNNYRDYIGDAEYLNGQQDIIHFTEGYAQRDITTDGDGVWNGWVYKYTLKDHLGNTRVTYSDKDKNGLVTTGDIEQVNHYYPFGLNMEGPWSGADGAYKFQYNSKELNSDFGLDWMDYGARFYDAAVDRWWSVDPESESGGQSSWNPYHYVMDNPVKNIDPDGREGEGCCGGALAADIISSSFGVAVGFTDNLFGTNLRDNVSLGSNQQAFQAGLNVADKGSLIGGATMVVGGGAVAAGGGAVSLTVVGGTIGVPAAVAGTVIGGAGVWINQNAVKHLQESQVKASSSPPNPNGKKGGQAHQDGVEEAAKDLKNQGYDKIDREVPVSTPNGQKGKRYVDVQGTNTSTGQTKQIQVGKQNKNGTPVVRERNAIKDIKDATGTAPDFKPYNN